jgi:hypothetical protein
VDNLYTERQDYSYPKISNHWHTQHCRKGDKRSYTLDPTKSDSTSK